MIDLTNPEAVVAEAERRRKLREQGARTFDVHALGPQYGALQGVNTPAPLLSEFQRGVPSGDVSARRIIDEAEIGELEKVIERECDKIVLALNGRIVKFSHPGKTKQTPGIADRIYAFPRLKLITWWEHKTPENEQSPAQHDFEKVVTSCGHEYHAGGLGDFKAWLTARGVVAGFSLDGTPIPLAEDHAP